MESMTFFRRSVMGVKMGHIPAFRKSENQNQSLGTLILCSIRRRFVVGGNQARDGAPAYDPVADRSKDSFLEQ